MAATSFKQQCPSCEAMVPIKDASLVGKKIDCPKCKYRFVVEAAPESGDEEDVAPETKKSKKGDSKATAVKSKAEAKKRRDAEDYEEDEEGLGRARRKKAPAGNTKMIVGVSLAVVAVGILGVAGWFLYQQFGAGDDAKSTAGGSGGGSPTTPGGSAPVAEASREEEKPQPAVPAVVDIRNLLPRDSDFVMNLSVQDLLHSSLGKLNNYMASSLSPQHYEKNFGISSEDVERMVMAANLSQNWSFMIVRTTKPINADAFKKAMPLKPADKPIQGQEYYVLDPLELLKTTGAVPAAQLSLLQNLPKNQNQMVAVRFHDDKTLVMGNIGPVKQFLESGGNPPRAAEASGPGGAMTPMGGAPGGMPMGGMPMGGMGRPMGGKNMMAGDAGPGNPMMGGPPGMGGTASPSAASGLYLTISPRLKAMMDKLEAKPVLLSIGADIDSKFDMANLMVGGVIPAPISTIGAAVQAEGGISLVAAVEGRTEQNTQTLLTRADSLTDMVKELLESKLDLAINWTKPDPNTFTNMMAPPGMGGMGDPDAGGPGGDVRGSGMRMRQMMMNRGAGGGMVGGQPGMPGMPNDQMMNKPPPKDDKPTFGTLTIDGPRRIDKTLELTVKLDKDAWDHLFTTYASPYFLRQKGNFDMQMAKPRPHDLGQALRADTDKNQKYPRGTYDRMLPPGRMNRPWLPEEKVSWMADLLPFLGHADVHSQINFQKSWRDKENLDPAMTLVPYFLDPKTPSKDWYVGHPGVRGEVAATHFVGISGIGLDSADYTAQSPEYAKRRGVFGYDRETPLTDISGGLSYTILLLQVPPSLRGPWLAGGGSTVRGVPETNSVQPFISSQYNGKRGTTAVMADGSVRFIAADVSDKVFQALCVVDQSKSKPGLDELPVVPNDQPNVKAGAPQAALASPPAPPKPAEKNVQ